MTHTYKYPRPALTVDSVVFGFDPEQSSLEVLLIERGDEPFKGQWALPGGFVEVSDTEGQGESLEDAAMRELQEETGLQVRYLEQLYTYGTPGRDPRGRVVSVAYYALVRSRDHLAQGGSDAFQAVWTPIAKALELDLAFDHGRILRDGLQRLKSKARYTPIGFELLPETFTLYELQQLYEHLLMRDLDPSNFRKKMLDLGILKESGSRPRGSSTVTLYAFDQDAYRKAGQSGGFNFDPRYVKEKG